VSSAKSVPFIPTFSFYCKQQAVSPRTRQRQPGLPHRSVCRVHKLPNLKSLPISHQPRRYMRRGPTFFVCGVGTNSAVLRVGEFPGIHWSHEPLTRQHCRSRVNMSSCEKVSCSLDVSASIVCRCFCRWCLVSTALLVSNSEPCFLRSYAAHAEGTLYFACVMASI